MSHDVRGVSPVIGVVLMVAIVVVLATLVGTTVIGIGDAPQSPAPRITVTHSLVEDGGEDTIAITLTGGAAVRIDRLYVIGSTDVDVGGPPGSASPADDSDASARENLTESTGGNPPQVGIGDRWAAGETIHVDPVGSADGLTVRIYWTTGAVAGANPSTGEGANTYEIAEITVT